MTLAWLAQADRTSPWSQARVVVLGIGASGFAAADALLEVGAQVTVVDEDADEAARERGTLLEMLDGTVQLGPGATGVLGPDVDLVVTSPGVRPTAALLTQAAERGIPIWGEVELAWRFMFPDRVVPWLCVTGTNGKTTTTQMLESMLLAHGLQAAAVGNIGRPVMEAVQDRTTHYDAFAVELSSFQLHWSHSLQPHSSVVLNLQPDHLEWYAHTPDPMAAYGADKAKIYSAVSHSCVYNVAEPVTESMVEQAEVVEGARAIGFTLGVPSISMLGVVDDLLVDRAFVTQRRSSALELATLADVQPAAPHNVANALAAAALARSFGVGAPAVAQGLRGLTLDGHRIQTVAEINGVRYVDDSKATNPHAADASLQAFDSVVWIAGGQAKGVSMDDLVARHAGRLRAAVLLGVDRGVIADALARHAPDVPVIVIDNPENEAMDEAVRQAAGLARSGDTVLLAPGCASLDMWSSYAARGDQFAEAVRSLRP